EWHLPCRYCRSVSPGRTFARLSDLFRTLAASFGTSPKRGYTGNMKPHNKSLARWLAYAPWAAAVLVGLCFIALVVRLSTGRSDATVAQQDLASSAATEKSSESTHVTHTRLASALNGSGSASQRPTEGSTEHP